MTAIVLLRVPGHGAVIAADSRVISGTEIITDACEKIAVFGSAVVATAGRDGGLMASLEATKSWVELRQEAHVYQSSHQALEWALTGYCRVSDKLRYLDSDGAEFDLGLSAQAGSGGPYALGFLGAHGRPDTLEKAAQLAVGAIREAIRRDSACGGRVRAVIVPRLRRGKIVHVG